MEHEPNNKPHPLSDADTDAEDIPLSLSIPLSHAFLIITDDCNDYSHDDDVGDGNGVGDGSIGTIDSIGESVIYSRWWHHLYKTEGPQVPSSFLSLTISSS